MAQRIVTLCDVHQRNEEDAPGATWQITLQAPGEAKPQVWEIDLCEDDAKTLRDLGVMLGTVGRPASGRKGSRKPQNRSVAASPAARVNTAPRESQNPHNQIPALEVPTDADGHYPCPVDGCDLVSATRDGITSHLRHRHDLSVAEAYGFPTPYPCGVEGCDRAFSHPQGAGNHRRMAHGIRAGDRGAEAAQIAAAAESAGAA